MKYCLTMSFRISSKETHGRKTNGSLVTHIPLNPPKYICEETRLVRIHLHWLSVKRRTENGE